jgi:hypothetical protein
MKPVLLILFLALTFGVHGQTDSMKPTEQYFEFTAVKKGLFEKGYGFNITISFGQKYFSTDSIIREKITNKIQSFSKIEDVLEYMNLKGWKLATAYTTSHDHYYTYFYIMKKEI